MRPKETDRAIAAVFRIEWARLVAGLTRLVRDVGVAEELAQDALVVALERWPDTGVPDNPGAWLMTTAKHRALDRLRRDKQGERHAHAVAVEAEAVGAPPDLDAARDAIGDDVLRLMFIACHPVLSPDARVGLTLRLVGGLSTGEIARAFIVPEATLAQRIVRAKRTLTEARIPFELPDEAERKARLGSVLEVLYLIFNEGYAATTGEDWMRPALADDALRLARILAELAPREAEVHGLVALLELQSSRTRARRGPQGEAVLLSEQRRALWDRLLIGRGLAALRRADALATERGPFTLQAAIAACHATAVTAADTDWVRIAALYAALVRIAPSPVVELNRAVALSRAFGPGAGLALVDALVGDGALEGYHLLHAVRADLLAELGRASEARVELERAATLTENARERALLLERAAACDARRGP